MEDFGTVEYKGKEISLMQYPYISPSREGYYEASAEDDEGNLYDVFWAIIREDCDDESESCDWEDYYVEKI